MEKEHPGQRLILIDRSNIVNATNKSRWILYYPLHTDDSRIMGYRYNRKNSIILENDEVLRIEWFCLMKQSARVLMPKSLLLQQYIFCARSIDPHRYLEKK
ncbi:hypothetical protein LOAG_02613 [Loa loa]|uniref:Uncharacterized protein n=1 Tax=Loa loa TaxID=7209 RepID=A0A1S0U748_LOALO|nr:hypothetical protein LOAG_02613 [Loa loa]EFO25873.1 hypothetical protein LOAG_02613 [Loa loa]